MSILRVSIVSLALAALCSVSGTAEITEGESCEEECPKEDAPNYTEGSDETNSESEDLMQDSNIEKEEALLKEMEDLKEKIGKIETRLEETSKMYNQKLPYTDLSKSNNHVKRDLKCNNENNSEEEEITIGVKMRGTSGEEEGLAFKHCRPERDDTASNYIAMSGKNVARLFPSRQMSAYMISVQYPRYNPWYQMSGYPPFYSYNA